MTPEEELMAILTEFMENVGPAGFDAVLGKE